MAFQFVTVSCRCSGPAARFWHTLHRNFLKTGSSPLASDLQFTPTVIASSQPASLLDGLLRQITATLIPASVRKEARAPGDPSETSETTPFPMLLQGLVQEHSPQVAAHAESGTVCQGPGEAPAVAGPDEDIPAPLFGAVSVLSTIRVDTQAAIPPVATADATPLSSTAPPRDSESIHGTNGQAIVPAPETRSGSPALSISITTPVPKGVSPQLPSRNDAGAMQMPGPAVLRTDESLDSQAVPTDDAQVSDPAAIETAAEGDVPANADRSERSRNESKQDRAVETAAVAKGKVGSRALRPVLLHAQSISGVSKKVTPQNGRISLPISHSAPEQKIHARTDTREISGKPGGQPPLASPDPSTATNESSARAIVQPTNLQPPFEARDPISAGATRSNLVDRSRDGKQSELAWVRPARHSLPVQTSAGLAGGQAKVRPVNVPAVPGPTPPANTRQGRFESSQCVDKSAVLSAELMLPMQGPVPSTATPGVRPKSSIRSMPTGDAGEKPTETARPTDDPGTRPDRAPDSPIFSPDTSGPTSGQFWRGAMAAQSRDSDALAELAFHGNLVPVAEKVEPTGKDRPALRPEFLDRVSQLSSSSDGSLDAGDTPVRAVSAAQFHTNARDSQSANGNPEPDFNPEPDANPVPDRKKANSRNSVAQPDIPESRNLPYEPRAPQPSISPDSSPAKAVAAPVARAATVLEPELPKSAAPTRDIKLEVSSGDQRVELHVVDQGGDVHVAVRTPDSHLAGELRENLPTLSSRLEQTGLRPEEWHTTTPANTEWHRQVEHTAGSASYDPNGQQFGHQGRGRQDDPEQRQPKRPEQASDPNEKGREFAWFMPSPI